MQLFYQPVLQPSAQKGVLTPDESAHCIRVLRFKAGDIIRLVDGKGGFYEARITRPDSAKCEFSVQHVVTEFGKRPFSIHLAIAPTKNVDRIEWMVEKCVELGIDEISFLFTAHSERRHFKTDRVEKIAVAAMKQSVKAFLPLLHEPVAFNHFIEKSRSGLGYIAHLEAGKTFPLFSRSIQPNHAYTVLIGPEGGFSEPEVDLAFRKGFQPVSLGASRLRTETAGLAACHIIHVIHSLTE